MMVVKATEALKQEIYYQWKQVFSFDDRGSIDFFFHHYFNADDCYVLLKDNQMVSALNVFKHDVMFNDKKIRVSYLVGIFTREEHQGKGYMTELLLEVLDFLSHQDLFTVLMAYHPSLYEAFGFKTVISRKKVMLTRNMIPQLSTMGITYQVSNRDLLRMYQKFTAYFTGYKVRDEAYFAKIKQDLEAQNGKLVAYLEKDQVLGYMMYTLHTTHIEVSEIVYFNSDTLYRLLNFAASLKDRMDVYVSTAENLGKLFPKAVVENVPFLMARLNDVSLFNELYQVHIHTVQEAFSMAKRPLFFHEYQ